MRYDGKVSIRDGTKKLQLVLEECRVVKFLCLSCSVARNLFWRRSPFFSMEEV